VTHGLLGYQALTKWCSRESQCCYCYHTMTVTAGCWLIDSGWLGEELLSVDLGQDALYCNSVLLILRNDKMPWVEPIVLRSRTITHQAYPSWLSDWKLFFTPLKINSGSHEDWILNCEDPSSQPDLPSSRIVHGLQPLICGSIQKTETANSSTSLPTARI
jgi:hypothetical protein